MTSPFRVLTLAALIAAGVAPASAQERPAELRRASIEELLDLEVTSAGRRQQRSEDVAAAVFVLSRGDISRSGLTSLPELLRLVPGVQVARVNSNKWAVSIRGFNAIYSNKLLILVDGRSVYNRAFSGVFWETLDLPLDEIDRIEVIRGPGGALWGSNAVNGIINIITRSAKESPGLSLTLAAGTLESSRAAISYAGAMGAAAYRVYSQWSTYGNMLDAGGAEANDRWRSLTSGFRVDWSSDRNAAVAAGHYTAGRTRPGWSTLNEIAPGGFRPSSIATDTREFTALARWTFTARDGSALQVQGYSTRVARDEAIFAAVERSSDLDVQYERSLGPRIGVVFGGGYRHIRLSTASTVTLQIAPEKSHIINTFAQADIELTGALQATVGARLERDSLIGSRLSPSVRFMWRPGAAHRVWAAVARAHRTPSATDRSLRINVAAMAGPGLPVLAGFIGNPDHSGEQLTQIDAGYRIALPWDAAIEVAAFRGRYNGMSTSEPLEPVFELAPLTPHIFAGVQSANLMNVTASGVEINGEWEPIADWRLEASYSALRISPQVQAASRDASAAFYDGHAPTRQWQAHSTAQVHPRLQLRASLFQTGALTEMNVPSYTRVDAHAQVKLSQRFTASIAGRNLAGRSHQEFSDGILASSHVPRSVHAQLRWHF